MRRVELLFLGMVVFSVFIGLGGCDDSQPSNTSPAKQKGGFSPWSLVFPPKTKTKTIADWGPWVSTDFFDSANELELCAAISSGETEKLKSLLDNGAELNTPGKFGMTVLYWAFAEENMEAFQLLLDRGADPDRTLTEDIGNNKYYNMFLWGESVLFTSLRCYKPDYSQAALKYSRNSQQINRRGRNLLHVFLHEGFGFGRPEHLQALLDSGIDINAVNEYGNTPCHLALGLPNPKHCLPLLKAGADPSIRDNDGHDVADDLEYKLKNERPGAHDARLDPIIAWLSENYREIKWDRP